jgi:hypothetical protein
MKSAFSIFGVPKSDFFFCEAATETQNQKVKKTPHINNRPPGIRIFRSCFAAAAVGGLF